MAKAAPDIVMDGALDVLLAHDDRGRFSAGSDNAEFGHTASPCGGMLSFDDTNGI